MPTDRTDRSSRTGDTDRTDRSSRTGNTDRTDHSRDVDRADRIARRLERAVRTSRPVRLERDLPGSEALRGIVLATGPAWTLLARCENHEHDGWSAVRTADISRVKRQGGDDCLTLRVLRRDGNWPPPAPPGGTAVDDLPTVLTAASHGGTHLLAVHYELLDPQACWIGALTALRPRSLRLHQVDTEADWYPEPTKFRFRELTRVDFGGRYERILQDFAGPAPAAS